MKVHSIIKCIHSCGREKLAKQMQRVYLKEKTAFIWEPTLIEIFDDQDEAFTGAMKQREIAKLLWPRNKQKFGVFRAEQSREGRGGGKEWGEAQAWEDTIIENSSKLETAETRFNP